MSLSQTQTLFADSVSQQFRFLAEDFGFKGPSLEIKPQAGVTIIRYVGNTVALECVLDEREQNVGCRVALVNKEHLPKSYAVDLDGKIVRENLSQLLRRRGVLDTLFRNVSGLSFQERMQVTLEDFARMLRTHAADVLADKMSSLE